MRNGKKGNGLILVALVGLLAVICVGAWLIVGDTGSDAGGKPMKPGMEAGR